MRHSSVPLLSTVALLLSACGGGSGSTPASTPAPAPTPVPATPLAVGASIPAPGGASGTDATPSLMFNQALDATTVSVAAVTLSSPIGAVNSGLALNGNTVTLTPTQPLVWGSHYQLSAATTLRATAGGVLAAPYSTGFDTRMPTWSAMVKSPVSKPAMGNLQTAGARNGDVVAVWTEVGANGASQVTATRYTAATQSWGTTASIQGTEQRGESPVLRADDAGNACAVWEEQLDNGKYAIKAARYNAANGRWSAPAIVSRPGEYSSHYSGATVAIGRTGDIIVAWKQYHSTVVSQATIDIARFDAASLQWTPARSLQDSPADTDFPIAAIDAAGNAMVVWSQAAPNGGADQAYAARYDARARGWGPNSLVTPNAAGGSSVQQLAFDAAGDALATISLPTPQRPTSLHVIRYTGASNSWGQPELMDTAYSAATLAVDAAGNALLVWPTYTVPSTFNINSRRYQRSTGTWTALPNISSYTSSIMPLAFDPAGNAVTSWVNYDGGVYSMVTMRFNAAAGKWDAPVSLASGTSAMGQPALSLDQSGQAMLLWAQFANLYSSPVQAAYARLTGR
ncbi:Ig-like domain-containing protein [Duganella sp. BJB1802]|uniref:Ig-like domain-containing protein n=1 Tax=Duganella sp. BJB1802 TaxID=2744575 RepID=UPI001592D473|nr:Ig-like domain-containing protein [Duganella sp. BJB1802]NVD74901.1 Ig-like domain-containing protein [Duganella sp. BJB1802]